MAKATNWFEGKKFFFFPFYFSFVHTTTYRVAESMKYKHVSMIVNEDVWVSVLLNFFLDIFSNKDCNNCNVMIWKWVWNNNLCHWLKLSKHTKRKQQQQHQKKQLAIYHNEYYSLPNTKTLIKTECIKLNSDAFWVIYEQSS